MLSVVIPVYNEKNLDLCVERIESVLKKIHDDYEIIFVDDGSPDNVWNELSEIADKNKKIKAIALSRNFGKENAICAGFENASGDCVVCMDSDMQHPPEIIPEMYDLWKSGYEVVEGVKKKRIDERKIYSVCSRIFYKVFKCMSHMDLNNSSDFKLLDRGAVDAWKQLREHEVFFRGMSRWIGFKHIQIYFDVDKRMNGESRWSVKKLFSLAVSAITSYSALPLYMSAVCGGLFFLLFTLMLIYAIYMKVKGYTLDGFEIVIILQLMIGGILMTGLGMIGVYVGKIYSEAKRRPRYIIKEIKNNRE